MNDDTSVLIVGAGPTGLLLAADLARRGVACRIVEEADVRTTAPRAINIHPRSLEVMADLGVAEQALDLGHQVARLNSYAAREPAPGRPPRWLGRVDMSVVPSSFPFTLTLPQPMTEQLLEDSAAEHGVLVERRVRLNGFTQDADGVTAELEHLEKGTIETCRYGWAVGCDGIGSTVRKAAGIPFDGFDYPDALVSADVEVEWAYDHAEAHVISGRSGSLRCMPVPGEDRWRIVGELPPGDQEELTLARFERLMHGRGVTVRLRTSHWMAAFRIHRRLAASFRSGRALLAGDAAHVHSPSGAQGMNIGMQDSYNLGWKLAQVVHGQSRPELLDTYATERRAVALATLDRTHRSIRAVQSRGRTGRLVRDTASRVLLNVRPLQRRRSLRGSQLSTNYRNGPLSDENWQGRSGPQAGDRAPEVRFGPANRRRGVHELLHGTRAVLLLFAGDGEVEGLAESAHCARRRGVAAFLVTRRALAVSDVAEGPARPRRDPARHMGRPCGQPLPGPPRRLRGLSRAHRRRSRTRRLPRPLRRLSLVGQARGCRTLVAQRGHGPPQPLPQVAHESKKGKMATTHVITQLIEAGTLPKDLAKEQVTALRTPAEDRGPTQGEEMPGDAGRRLLQGVMPDKVSGVVTRLLSVAHEVRRREMWSQMGGLAGAQGGEIVKKAFGGERGVDRDDLVRHLAPAIAEPLRRVAAVGRITEPERAALAVLLEGRVRRLVGRSVSGWAPTGAPGKTHAITEVGPGPATVEAVAHKAAGRLGVEIAKLRTARDRGFSLAQVAGRQGVERAGLIRVMGDEAVAQVEQAVGDGLDGDERSVLAMLVRLHVEYVADHRVGDRMSPAARGLGHDLATCRR
ncbi:FAD-dependent monooxygenase [Spongiactinospora sp. 9N601]|uniref:FAD-dependent monooxygenase n=1 Tax=Spongiactinospora sp. 9N601 TaxID=3375149 RepID=UPI003795A7F4